MASIQDLELRETTASSDGASLVLRRMWLLLILFIVPGTLLFPLLDLLLILLRTIELVRRSRACRLLRSYTGENLVSLG